MKHKNLLIIEKQISVCENCGAFVDTDVVEENGVVYFLKHCSDCREQKTKICVDVDYYRRSHSMSLSDILCK